MAASADWTAAVDDLLCERWGKGCTLCGDRHLAYADIWQVDGLAIAVSLCEKCWHGDPERRAVDALLRQRYGHGARMTDTA